jgi:hypothetical protein
MVKELPSVFKTIKILFTLFCLFAGSDSYAAALETIPSEGVLAEINLARSEPLTYAGFLRERRRQFEGDSYTLTGTDIVLRSVEGPAAVDEAIDYLVGRKPVAPLVWSAGLAAAATELVEEQGKSGITGHSGRKSGAFLARVKKQGIQETWLGENIAYGLSSPREVIMALIIDDGVPSRGHRKNLFNQTFAKVGVACGFHPRYEILCAIDFSD